MLPIALAVVLALPGFFWVLHGGAEPQQDMRTLSEWPHWHQMPIEKWANAYEMWLNDHYPFRSTIVRWNATIRHRWLHEPSNAVIVGQDGWLFYSGNHTIDDLLGRDRLTDAELTLWQHALEKRYDWWKQHGAQYLFVIVPNKSTIYPERLPAIYQSQIRPGKLDQLLEYLRAHDCGVPILDLRAALLASKAVEPVYWQTDTHWNAAGLLAACKAIRTKLDELGVVCGHADWPLQAQVAVSPREGDCVRVLRMHDAWPLEQALQLRIGQSSKMRVVKADYPAITRPLAFESTAGKGRAVLLGDSFFRVGGLASDAQGAVPLLLDFERFVTFWPWEGDSDRATYELLAEIAAKEKPTVIVEQWTERYLHTIPADDPDSRRAREDAARK